MNQEEKSEIRIAYCPECKDRREFEREDAGVALISVYRCKECRRMVGDAYFSNKTYQVIMKHLTKHTPHNLNDIEARVEKRENE